MDASLLNLVRRIPYLSGMVDAGQEKRGGPGARGIVCKEVCAGTLRRNVIRSNRPKNVRYARPTR